MAQAVVDVGRRRAAQTLTATVIKGNRAMKRLQIGKDVVFAVGEATVIVKISKEGATTIGLGDLVAGDRVLVNGRVDRTIPDAPVFKVWLIIDRGPAPARPEVGRSHHVKPLPLGAVESARRGRGFCPSRAVRTYGHGHGAHARSGEGRKSAAHAGTSSPSASRPRLVGGALHLVHCDHALLSSSVFAPDPPAVSAAEQPALCHQRVGQVGSRRSRGMLLRESDHRHGTRNYWRRRCRSTQPGRSSTG